MKPNIEIDMLRELIRLDGETGHLYWLKQRGGAKPGDKAGCFDGQGYVTLVICGKQYMAHRVVWALHHGAWPELQLDHKDLDKGNNKPSNLRTATSSQNLANTALFKSNTSGHKGVVWSKKHCQWQAQIRIAGRLKYLGLHTTMHAASAAYSQAAQAAWGHFSRTSA